MSGSKPWPGAGGFAAEWDGRDDAGIPLDPGPVQIAADLFCNERLRGFGEAWAHVLRLGVVAVDLRGETVPLAYHKLDLWERGLTFLGGEVPELLADRPTPYDLADLDEDTDTHRNAIHDAQPLAHSDRHRNADSDSGTRGLQLRPAGGCRRPIRHHTGDLRRRRCGCIRCSRRQSPR